MNRIKAILIGTITGVVVGLASTALAGIGWRLLNAPGHWDGTVTMALLTFCLIQGAVIGVVNGGLCAALCNLEQVMVSVLLSLAMGAVRVIPGGFDGRSLLPVAIYGLAIVNGGVTAVTLLLILRRTAKIDERNLLIN
ncbi:MAG: hypothetical protein H6669_15645 [Ardenticatenaceae bacterium]|nr:hypothetical protein [Ardenticatenaceae bacterium]